MGQRGTLFRGALAAVLCREPDLIMVAELTRWDDTLSTALRTRPDVAVVDFTLPGFAPPDTGSADERCQAYCRALPASAMLVVLDRSSCAGAGRSLIQLAPRVGLIDTEASPAALVAGVRQLARGESVLHADLAMAVLTAADNPLTVREREVLRLALDGTPTKEIARRLFLSAGTVRNYLSRILVKTGARTRLEAIRLAQDAGWI